MNRLQLLLNILILPVLTILLAYSFGHNGYETFVATSIGLLFIMAYQAAESLHAAAKSRHWLVTKALLSCLPLGMWLLSLICLMLLITGAGHDPRIPLPHINWLIVIVLVVAYMLSTVKLNFAETRFGRTLLPLFATLYAVAIMYSAALRFYSDPGNAHTIALVIAGQLQYVLLYVVLRTRYVEWAVALGQSRLGTSNAFSPQPEPNGPYLLLATLPFFIPFAAVIAFTL